MFITTRTLAAGLVIAAVAAIGTTNAEARSRKFACPMPDKRACMSARQVYESTHNGEQILVDEKAERTRKAPPPPRAPRPTAELVAGQPVPTPNRCCDPVRTAVTVKGDTLAVASPVVGVVPQHGTASTVRNEMVVRTTRNEPFREPAQVMRIYISPWEDEQGDLHMGGFVFSEIAPRKWSVGTRAFNPGSNYRLLTLSRPSRDAAQDANNGKGDATARTVRTE